MSEESPRKSFVGRHPVALALFLTILIVCAWVSHFLFTFDLNNYREQLQSELSKRSSLPVRLGAAHLKLREIGIAISFDNIHIGSEQSRVEIEAPELWGVLEWRGLLQQQLHFSRIGLDQPTVRAEIAPAPAEAAAAGTTTGDGSDLSSLAGTRIKKLSILNGQLKLTWQKPTGPAKVELSGLSGNIQEFGPGKLCRLDLGAELVQPGSPAPLALHGSMRLPGQADALSNTSIDLHLEGSSIDSNELLRLWAPSTEGLALSGRLRAALQVYGTPHDALSFRADLSAGTLQLTPGADYIAPIPIKHLLASGKLSTRKEEYLLHELDLQLNGSRSEGEVVIDTAAGEPSTTIRLSNSSLSVKDLKHWLPDRHDAARYIQEHLHDKGSLWIEQAELLLDEQTMQSGQLLSELQGRAEDLRWTFAADRSVELPHIQVDYKEGRWSFMNGRGRIGPLQFSLDGTIDTASDEGPKLDLLATGQAETAALQDWLSPELSALATSGQLPFELRMQGGPDRVLTDLKIDLSTVELRYGEALHVPPSEAARFNLHGKLSGESFEINHAHLAWPPLSGRLNGRSQWDGQKSSTLHALLEISDLAAAGKLSPHTEKLDLRGGLAAAITWSSQQNTKSPEVNINLNDVALATGGAIADLSQINGRIDLVGQGLQSQRLTAHIGQSPVTVKAVLEDFSAPVLQLDLTAADIRADELIFYSDRQHLKDLKGKMTLSPEAITFDPVAVTLEGGTQATVYGRIDNFKSPRVALDITSEFARIDEIIGLWTDQSEAAQTARQQSRSKPQKPRVRPDVKIRAHAKRGDLYGMAFRDAEGLIVPRDGMLIIHPLDFKVGEGYCNAQVLVDFAKQGPSLLRISGHAEDVDAHEVHNELLKRNSILTGKMRGDFYLQGQAGKSFLPTSYGSFHITTRDGVLRQFKTLSKVFSILNVAQLFKLKLPDMDQEGLPFSEISGDLLLEEGVLKSDGLTLKSEAMNQSYVGEFNFIDEELDLILAVHPLGTVDKIVSRLPLAGWLLTGEEKALITAHFAIKGTTRDPDVQAIPVTSVSSKARGIILRTLGLPIKLVEDPAVLWGGE